MKKENTVLYDYGAIKHEGQDHTVIFTGSMHSKGFCSICVCFTLTLAIQAIIAGH